MPGTSCTGGSGHLCFSGGFIFCSVFLPCACHQTLGRLRNILIGCGQRYTHIPGAVFTVEDPRSRNDSQLGQTFDRRPRILTESGPQVQPSLRVFDASACGGNSCEKLFPARAVLIFLLRYMGFISLGGNQRTLHGGGNNHPGVLAGVDEVRHKLRITRNKRGAVPRQVRLF